MQEGTVIARRRSQLIIERPRLIKLLDDAGARVILLLAPAGYGKTTLAQQWTRRRDRVSWYLGGRGMIDVAGLSVGIADVLARMGDPARLDMLERVRILASRGHDARGLAKAVSGGAPGADWLLVVDDYHYAHGAEDAEAFFEELLSLTQFRLLLTSRERPSWLPARSVVYGEATAIEMDALAFTDDEALAVLGGEGEGIVAEARGWPAVIGLAAVRGSSEVTAGLAPEELYRFFAEDLFSSASPELREAMFLLALAGVDSARALLGAAHVQLVAEAAERGFLTEEGGVVHPLLRGFLLTKIAELDDGTIRSLVEQAVAYLAGEHRWDDCLFVLEQFPQDDLILSTLERGLAEILDSGHVTSLGLWLALATRQRLDDPLLLLVEAERALRQSDHQRAQVFGEEAGDLLTGDLAARAYLAAARAAHLRDLRPDVLRLTDVVIDGDHATRPTNTQTEALWLQFNSKLEMADSAAQETLERLLAQRNDDPNHRLRLLSARGLVLTNSGNVRDGLPLIEMAAARVSSAHDPFVRTGTLHYLAYAYLLAGRYVEALTATERALEEARETGLEFAVDFALLRRAAAFAGMRRVREALRTINELNRRASSAPDFVRDNLVLLHVKLAISAGDLPRARSLLASDFARRDRAPFRGELHGYNSICLAALGNRRAALAALEDDEDCFQQVEPGALREIARAILSLGQRSGAHRSVDAVRRLLTSGVVDPLVTGFRACPELLRAAVPSLSQELGTLLVRSRDADMAKAVGINVPRESRPREALSPREQEVVELMIQGRANHEIARILFISKSTTKVHVRHIYDKLGVHNRADAVRMAMLTDLTN